MFSSAVLVLAASIAAGQADVKVPANVLAEIAFLAGVWEEEGTFSGDPFKGKSQREWNPGKCCLIMHTESNRAPASGITGWDPKTNEIVETWYTADGVRVELRYTVVSAKVWEGTVVAISPDGIEDKGTIRLEKTGADSFAFKAKSPAVEMTATARRLKK